MNWVTENKFLAGFLGATILGTAVLGFLLLTAKGQHNEAHAAYQSQSAELNRLLSLEPFPNSDNLKKFEDQKKELLTEISTLQQSLSANVIPLEPIGPTQFQDRLREAVSQVVAKAAEGGGKRLPEKFYLGFERYETQPPTQEAAAPLWRELKAIKLVVDLILDQKVFDTKAAVITKLDRTPLPEEGGRPTAATPPAAGKATTSPGAGKELVNRVSFDIAFNGDTTHFRNILNGIVSSKTQFFVPRHVTVKNEKDAAPAKIDVVASAPPNVVDPAADPNAPATPTPPVAQPTTTNAPPAPPAPPEAKPSEGYIFGMERVDVNLRLEILDFAAIAVK